ncbi:MAG TPA: TlpA disulfide reductase family protein [Haliangiales bacterium]|nr:TlpA disulfide reductase family protein [Haliangiales bacterium]
MQRAALVVLALFAACSREKPTPLPPVEKPLPLLARETLAGGRFDPESVAGKVVVVNFWSPGCVPCAKEAPGLQAAANALAGRGLSLVTVMSDGTPAEALAFARRAGLTAPVVVGDLDLLKQLNVLVYPWTLIVDRDGRAVRAIRGGRAQDQLTREFEKYL